LDTSGVDSEKKFFEKAEPCAHLGYMEKNKRTLRFCHALLGFGINRCRAMTNFVMSLASSSTISHPVELALSPFCHYHYSNLSKILRDWQVGAVDFRRFIRFFVPPPRERSGGLAYYAFTHDVTKVLKAHSPCLENRQYVPISNNVIASNRSLGVGYPVSVLHFGAGEQGWCPPLALDRLEPDDDANEVAIDQIRTLLEDKTLPFGQGLNLLRADASYGKAIFLSPLYDMDNLVLIVRLRAGMKVWERAQSAKPSKGATPIYGAKRYLTEHSQWKTHHKKGVAYQVWQEALCEQLADDHVEKQAVLGNGRVVVIDTRRWNNLLIRTKDGASMKNKPLDVLRVQVLDAQTQKPVFDRPLFLAVSGTRKNLIDTSMAQEQYRERYDVEPFYRFAKNKLLLDKLQTPTAKHLDSWMRMVQITSWLLFTARQEINQICCPVWQKYLPKNKAAQEQVNPILTIAQTQKAIHQLFSTFEPAPFLPLKCKKGAGRQKGQTFPQRTRFKVVKKIKKSIRKLKNQQNE